jgi:uncharacterized damage-inducible protein DinB
VAPIDLLSLYDYAGWANGRVLDAAARLDEADWRRPSGHPFGSVHGTMVHILSSEMLWLARWQGRSPTERAVAPEDLPTVAALRARWAPVAAELRAFLAAQDEAGWGRVIAYRTLDGRAAAYPLWQMLLQVVNHGTQHRAEAASLLTELGQSPGELDLIHFFRQRAAEAAAQGPPTSR